LIRVVDASVALKWFLQEDGSDRAADLLNGNDLLIAPDLIVAEVCNAAWKAVQAGMALPDQAEIIADRLPAVFDALVPLAELASAMAAAMALSHPVYDCFYLALSRQRDAQMVTADRKLLSKVAGTRWSENIVGL
jgi:predicted nucleic acid-binding protein